MKIKSPVWQAIRPKERFRHSRRRCRSLDRVVYYVKFMRIEEVGMKTVRTVPKTIGIIFLCLAFFMSWGCATMDKSQTGAVAGTGVGALIGQAIGRNTAGTLIGAGVGLGLGYIIGNELDKQDAKMRTSPREDETRLLANTSWRVVSVTPKPARSYTSIITTFSPNGTVTTTTTYPDGTVTRDVESYRVVGSTLVINKPDYVINSRFKIDGTRMYMDTGEHSIVMERI